MSPTDSFIAGVVDAGSHHPARESAHRGQTQMAPELARQDAELARAASALLALGDVVLAVPRSSLEAIDEACLASASTLGPAAIRG